MLLPPGEVQELNRRSTGMLNSVQRFFAHHLIEAFGCDYSTSGMTLEALQAKIKSFLELRTPDGPRHDTYVIYYSGHSHRSGEWALAGEKSIKLKQSCFYCIMTPILVFTPQFTEARVDTVLCLYTGVFLNVISVSGF